MSTHDDSLLGKAKDERDAWKRVRVSSGFMAAALGGFGLIGIPALILFPPGLIAAGLVLNAELKLIVADRKIEDPPRPDFMTATTVQSVLPFRDVFGASNLERVAALAFATLIQAVSTEEAMVLADERRQGAERFHAVEVVELRRSEHALLSHAAGRLNATLDALLQTLATDFEQQLALTDPLELQAPARGGTVQSHVSSVVSETLIRAGFPRGSLDRELEGSFDVGEVPDRFLRDLRHAADATGAYGRALLRNYPSDDDPEGGATAPLLPYRPYGGGGLTDPYGGLGKRTVRSLLIRPEPEPT